MHSGHADSVAGEIFKAGDVSHELLEGSAQAAATVALAAVLAGETTTARIGTDNATPEPIRAKLTPYGTEGYCWDMDENEVFDKMDQDFQND